MIDGGTLKLEQGASVSTGPIDFAAGANWGTLDLTGDGSGCDPRRAGLRFLRHGRPAGEPATSSRSLEQGKAGDHVVWTQDTATQGTLKVEGREQQCPRNPDAGRNLQPEPVPFE